jgi:excinuclease ABC subunit C
MFDGPAYVATLPELPGVYRMFDAADNLLYVGKAKRLRRRVGNYFLRPQGDARLASLVSQVDHMEFTVVRTETEALILEAQLIKTQKPRYNIQLRDNKGYPYIYLATQETWPRLSYHRGPLPKQGKAFGPFPSGQAVRSSLNHLQKVFQLRTCEDNFFRNRSRPCLQHQIGRCSAPCVKLIDEAGYQKEVRRATRFLEGRSDEVIQDLVADMQDASKAMAFEKAARYRDQIAHLRAIQAEQHVEGKKDTNLDIWVCAVNGDLAAITHLSFKDGASQGSRTFFPDLAQVLADLAMEDDSDGVSASVTCRSLLASYLPQYYLDHVVPEKIWIGEALGDHALLEDALQSINGGRPVELRELSTPESISKLKSEEQRWFRWAIQNRDESFSARLKNRQTIEGRYVALEEHLSLPPRTITRMECIDISHTGGERPVASSVVFDRTGAKKKFYRQFNIKDIEPGDDYAAIHQTVLRRLVNSEGGEEAWKLPEVWLIDGGKGQVHSALNAFEAWALGQDSVPERPVFIGVGKGVERRAGHETLWVVNPGEELDDVEPWAPGAHSPALQVIQQVRDESHRFAGRHHQARRDKARSTSPLENIDGVGPARRKLLLNSFGGWQALSNAGVEELAKVRGISVELATRIHAALHPAG